MTPSNIEESLIFSDGGALGVPEPTDDEINHAYNIFDAEKMKYYKGVQVSLRRDFRRHKREKPSEWKDFSTVLKLCKANGFRADCYIKFCFLNRLVPKARGRTLTDVSYLTNVPQIMEYARNKKEIERLFAIYRSIQRTIILVKKTVKDRGGTPKTVLKDILSSGHLSNYLTTGVVSPYFLALIPNVSQLVHTLMKKGEDDCVELIDMCNRIGIYGSDAIKSMKMFYPNAMAKTVIELCD